MSREEFVEWLKNNYDRTSEDIWRAVFTTAITSAFYIRRILDNDKSKAKSLKYFDRESPSRKMIEIMKRMGAGLFTISNLNAFFEDVERIVKKTVLRETEEPGSWDPVIDAMIVKEKDIPLRLRFSKDVPPEITNSLKNVADLFSFVDDGYNRDALMKGLVSS